MKVKNGHSSADRRSLMQTPKPKLTLNILDGFRVVGSLVYGHPEPEHICICICLVRTSGLYASLRMIQRVDSRRSDDQPDNHV